MNLGEILRTLLFGFPVPPEMIDPAYPVFLQKLGGLQLSLVITFLSFLFGIPLGLFLALVRTWKKTKSTKKTKKWDLSGGIRGLAVIFMEGIRAIPIIILVMLAFYLPYKIFSMRIPPVILAVGAFSLYAGVYLSEVFRSGFRAVDEGWIHSAMTLGLTRRQIFLKIKLPVVFRTMLPTFMNTAITVLKDTSVLVVVAVPELTYSARSLQVASPANYTLVLFLVILIYWILASSGSALVQYMESKYFSFSQQT